MSSGAHLAARKFEHKDAVASHHAEQIAIEDRQIRSYVLSFAVPLPLWLKEMASGSENRRQRCGSMTGVRSLDHPSGRSRLVCEQCDDLAQEIDPSFWRWFHYESRFGSEVSGSPTSTTSAAIES